MIRTNIHLALASLRSSKIRSFLTMVAVIIGVSSFTVVTSFVDGLRNSTVQEINDLGGNLVSVVSGDVIVEDESGNESFNFLAGQGSPTITEKDLESIDEIEGVEAVAPLELIDGSVFRGEKQLQGAFIIATSSQYPAAFAHEVKDGSFIEDKQTGNFAVVGSGIVDGLFAGNITLGSRITVKGMDFTVVGVIEDSVNTFAELLGFDQRSSVYISVENGKKLTNTPAQFQEIDLQIKDDVDPNKVITEIEEKLLENHNGEVDFSVLKQDQLVGLVDSLLGPLKIAGQALSGVMLFVASIVILLIMLITVRERTREIGIRKSIGATNANIMVQFLTEAVVLSWVGSVIGLVVGYVFGLLMQRYTELTPQYSINTLLALVVISSVVGMAAGVTPAWLAARRDPVESLRHE